MLKRLQILRWAILLVLIVANDSGALPAMTGVRVTDVTASSFAVVWMTDAEGEPSVDVFLDSQMTSAVNGVNKIPMAGTAVTKTAALSKGNIRVMVTGLQPGTSYYVRALMPDPVSPAVISYSPLIEVVTAAKTLPYKESDGVRTSLANDLIAFTTFTQNPGQDNGSGELVILELPGSRYPLSAYVGEGAQAPEVIFDLNNLYGADGLSADIAGGDRITLTVYKGGFAYSVLYYRRLGSNTGTSGVAEPLKGFFADVNMDGSVDDGDFELFRAQYGFASSDAGFNPDFDFVQDQSGIIDVKDFSRFSIQYGKQGL